MSRVAVIDLGTNIFNLLIVDIKLDNTFQFVYKTKISVKLGEGGINKGFIAPIAFNRGINALKTYKKTIEKYNVEKIYAIATSAIRGASNGSEFVAKAKEECNFEVHVITGDKEAELIYYGVRNAVKMNDNASLIIDIGGGSTEFIIANKNEIFWKHSFLLGVARLKEMFSSSDPITDKEKNILIDYFKVELQPLFEAIEKYPIAELIGSSGSFDSLAEMVANRFYSPSIFDGKTEYQFNLTECAVVHHKIINSTHAERLKIKGLVAIRVDMIVFSSILVNFILKSFSIPKMRLSTYSLKEGILFEK